MNKREEREFDKSKLYNTINEKINDFVNKYNKYPKYVKIPLWISCCMKLNMGSIEHYNLGYNTELLMYRDLIVCETITIDKIEEIEVF